MTEVSKSEIKVDVQNTKGKKIMVATPMYGGLGNTNYISSMLRLQQMCFAYGIEFQHAFLANESLIDRGRNGLADTFLTLSDADYMLFIDADIEFRPEDIIAMLSFEKDIICGPYPKKHINWPMIITAVQNGVTDPSILEKLVGEYVFTPLQKDTKLEIVTTVAEAGTGIMLIKRDVFSKMKAAYPENYYISDHSRDVVSGTKKEMHAYFRTAIVDHRYLSEDYYFCHNWRKMGGEVHLFPFAMTTHFGTYGFQGSVGHIIDTLRKFKKE